MKTLSVQPTTHTYTLDAQGQKLGRFASTVATHLRGKFLPEFTYHKLPRVRVTIKNIDKLAISDKKLTTHDVKRFTGYPGGLKSKLWGVAYSSDPKKFFLRVLRYMLPKNRQASQLFKNIKFE